MKILRLILGDQLNASHSWFTRVDADVVYCMMEMRQETEYVQHHIQKVMAFFEAMTRFSDLLKSKGHNVVYLKVDAIENTGILTENIQHLIHIHEIQKFEYQLPDEYRLDSQLSSLKNVLEIPVVSYDTEHFITTRNELADLFRGRKQYLMETFYRAQRVKTGVLMELNSPLGGKWNYDHDNRNAFNNKLKLPPKNSIQTDLSKVYERIQKAGIKTIGQVDYQHFSWPVDRNQSLKILDEFITYRLPYFGTYQDAMTNEDDYLFHSRLSFALNVKLLSPIEVIKTVEQAYYADKEKFSLNQVEGFIRQILGWREYMRGIYWHKMPEFKQLNYLEQTNKLPSWFWTGNTKMNCLSHSIKASLKNAYAHHIQRLMVTGNFALLAGVHPDEVDVWYLGIYIDAIEWVEITNTRGMSQFADGGIVGTKPYVSSATYIDKMGNYCKSCFYNKKEKTGDKACPFNSLYWHFYERNRDKLARNPRIGMMYNVWDKMDLTKKEEILRHADHLIEKLDEL
jgi:deoxyribodipyrimidine photolyase-related protein